MREHAANTQTPLTQQVAQDGLLNAAKICELAQDAGPGICHPLDPLGPVSSSAVGKGNSGRQPVSRRQPFNPAKTWENIIRARLADQGDVDPEPIMEMPSPSEFKRLSIQDLSAGSFPRAPVISGVYFLLRGDEVIYVGRSKDCHDRIMQHRASPMPFDAAFIQAVPAHRCVEAERFYIRSFNPRCNNDIITRGERVRHGSSSCG